MKRPDDIALAPRVRGRSKQKAPESPGRQALKRIIEGVARDKLSAEGRPEMPSLLPEVPRIVLAYSPIELTEAMRRGTPLDTDTFALVVREPKAFRCLYTQRVCFVDVDVNTDVQRLAMLRLAHRFVAVNPEYGLRCYQTAAGLRYIVTSHMLDPYDERSGDLMTELGVDTEYLIMCMQQRLYAARLDPKPERDTGKPHAVTRFLWQSGNPFVTRDALTVLKYHDKETFAHEERSLA